MPSPPRRTPTATYKNVHRGLSQRGKFIETQWKLIFITTFYFYFSRLFEFVRQNIEAMTDHKHNWILIFESLFSYNKTIFSRKFTIIIFGIGQIEIILNYVEYPFCHSVFLSPSLGIFTLWLCFKQSSENQLSYFQFSLEQKQTRVSERKREHK